MSDPIAYLLKRMIENPGDFFGADPAKHIEEAQQFIADFGLIDPDRKAATQQWLAQQTGQTPHICTPGCGHNHPKPTEVKGGKSKIGWIVAGVVAVVAVGAYLINELGKSKQSKDEPAANKDTPTAQVTNLQSNEKLAPAAERAL